MAPTTTLPMKEVVPLSCPQGWLTQAPTYRVSSTCVGRRRAHFQNVAAGERLGQVPHLVRMARVKGKR